MITILGMMSQLVSQTPVKLASESILQPMPKPANQLVLGAAVQPSGGATYNLSGSGVSATATSIPLASLTIPQNGYRLTDADFSSTFYVTLEPGNRSRQEFASCTTITQDAGTQTTLSGCTRGLSPISPYTASTSLQFSHGGGAQVIFSDPPQFFNQYGALANDETITGAWLVPTPLVSTGIANKAYVDATAFQGAATSTEIALGIVELATTAETAAGTASSTTGAPLVIKNANASSTYNGAYNNVVVVTKTNSGLANTIDPNFIATSSAYTLSGLIAFTGTGTTTFSATTSMASINLTNPPTGNLSRLLLATTTNVTIGTASTTLFSTTVPANVLYNGYNGLIRTRINLSAFAMTTNDRWQLEVLYGGVSVCCAATTTNSPLQVQNGSGYFDIDLYGNNANNSQEVYINPVFRGFADTNNASGGPFPFYIDPKVGTLSIDSTLPQTLQVIAKNSGGSAGTVSQVSSFLMR